MNNIDEMSVNAIRVLSADAIQKAKSGHPGLPLGAAPAAYELWSRHMNHNPANPKWENRDRFILSGGHGSMLLYSLLHCLFQAFQCFFFTEQLHYGIQVGGIFSAGYRYSEYSAGIGNRAFVSQELGKLHRAANH